LIWLTYYLNWRDFQSSGTVNTKWEFFSDLIDEFKDISFTPHCYDFQSIGSTQIFLWNEFIGGWTMAMRFGNNARKAFIQLILGY